jgi:hypothetical protein
MKIDFSSQLQRFQSMLSWLHCSGLVLRQNIMISGACDMGGCSPYGSQEVKRDRPKARYTLHRHAPSNPLSPIRSHLPQFSSSPYSLFNYESVSGLIHQLSQSPHDSITSQKIYLWTLHWNLAFNTAFRRHFLSKP